MKAYIRCDCGQPLRVSSRSKSKSFDCPKCNKRLTVEAGVLVSNEGLSTVQPFRRSAKKFDSDVIIAVLEEPEMARVAPQLESVTTPVAVEEAPKGTEAPTTPSRSGPSARFIFIMAASIALLGGIAWLSQNNNLAENVTEKSDAALTAPADLNLTPAELFAKYVQASNECDGESYVQCVESGLVTKKLAEVLLMHQPRLDQWKTNKDPEVQKQLVLHRNFYSKHGLEIPPRQIRRELLLMTTGQRTMLAEYIDLLKTAPLGFAPTKRTQLLRDEAIQISGSAAVGKIRTVNVPMKGREQTETIAFNKSKLGGWQISDINSESSQLQSNK